jgi:hypothetical protein
MISKLQGVYFNFDPTSFDTKLKILLGGLNIC